MCEKEDHINLRFYINNVIFTFSEGNITMSNSSSDDAFSNSTNNYSNYGILAETMVAMVIFVRERAVGLCVGQDCCSGSQWVAQVTLTLHCPADGGVGRILHSAEPLHLSAAHAHTHTHVSKHPHTHAAASLQNTAGAKRSSPPDLPQTANRSLCVACSLALVKLKYLSSCSTARRSAAGCDSLGVFGRISGLVWMECSWSNLSKTIRQRDLKTVRTREQLHTVVRSAVLLLQIVGLLRNYMAKAERKAPAANKKRHLVLPPVSEDSRYQTLKKLGLVISQNHKTGHDTKISILHINNTDILQDAIFDHSQYQF